MVLNIRQQGPISGFFLAAQKSNFFLDPEWVFITQHLSIAPQNIILKKAFLVGNKKKPQFN